MPRTEGVSSSVDTRPTLFRPRPASVARWSLVRRIGLPVWRTLSVFLSAMSLTFRVGGRLGGRGAVGAAADHVRDLLAALGRHLAGRGLGLQRFERRAHHV